MAGSKLILQHKNDQEREAIVTVAVLVRRACTRRFVADAGLGTGMKVKRSAPNFRLKGKQFVNGDSMTCEDSQRQ